MVMLYYVQIPLPNTIQKMLYALKVWKVETYKSEVQPDPALSKNQASYAALPSLITVQL